VADLIHELYPGLFTGPKNEAFRQRKSRCITRADAVICISEATRKDVVNFYKIDPRKVHLARLACSGVFKPLGPRKQVHPPVTDKPFFLYIGTRVHYKNYDFFIKSYAHWVKGKEVDLVLVGPLLNTQEQDDLARWGIGHRVHVLNAVDDEQLSVLYNQALAFVYPSMYEGFGIPLLEAMACGCPVIASDIPSSREIAKDAPFYFTLGDENSLKVCFGCVSDSHLVSAAQQKGFLYARDYSWEKTARETLAIWTQSMKDWEVLQ